MGDVPCDATSSLPLPSPSLGEDPEVAFSAQTTQDANVTSNRLNRNASPVFDDYEA